jgi:hypothetical protein
MNISNIFCNHIGTQKNFGRRWQFIRAWQSGPQLVPEALSTRLSLTALICRTLTGIQPWSSVYLEKPHGLYKTVGGHVAKSCQANDFVSFTPKSQKRSFDRQTYQNGFKLFTKSTCTDVSGMTTAQKHLAQESGTVSAERFRSKEVLPFA